jgi:hypothetical protein
MAIYKNPGIPAIANLLSLMTFFLYFCSMQSNQEILVDHFLEQLNLNKTAVSSEVYSQLITKPRALVRIDDVIGYLRELGTQFNKPEAVNALIENIEDDTNIIIHKLKFIPADDRPKVWVLNQINPLQVNTSAFLQECINIAGGIPVTEAGEADKIILINSDETIFTHIPDLLNNTEIASSKAVALDQLFVITKPRFAAIPGYHYVSELESLTEILQPKYFVYGHEGKNWLQFQLN